MSSRTVRPAICERWAPTRMRAGGAQPLRPLPNLRAVDLRHPRRRRSSAGAVRKDVQPRQPAVLDEIERALEHRLGLGRKPRDDVGAEDHLGPRLAQRLAEGDGVVTQVPALHPLQDQVVSRLQRQVQVRHQPRLAGDRLDQQRVRLDGVDGREPQPRQVRHGHQDRRHQIAEPPSALEIGAPARQVHAGQHHLVEPAAHQPRDLRDHRFRRHAARVSPAVGNDAEGAAMVTAGLHLHIGPRPCPQPVHQRRRRPGAPP